MSDQMSGPWDSAGGGTEVFPGCPQPLGLCWASLHVGSSHGGWAGLGGHHPYLPSMDALSFHGVLCPPLPTKGSQGHGCCPHRSHPPPQSVQPLPASPTPRSLIHLPPITAQGPVWSGEATAPPKAFLSDLEPGAPVSPLCLQRLRSRANGCPHRPGPLSGDGELLPCCPESSWSYLTHRSLKPTLEHQR